MMETKSQRDLFAGLTMGVFGALAIVEGQRLRTGTLTQMEPGFVPFYLGVLLVLVGLLIPLAPGHSDDLDEAPTRPDWRGSLCIVGGVAAFLLLGPRFGLIPASFACVLISAAGDRTATAKGAMLLAGGVTICGALLFHGVLGLPMPLVGW